MLCDVSVSSTAGWPVVHLRGELDISSVPQARQAVHEALGTAADRLVLDLQDLAFIDSAGLGVVVGALRRIRQVDGELRVVAPLAGPRRAFEVTGLDRLLTLVPTLDEAVLPVGDPGALGDLGA